MKAKLLCVICIFYTTLLLAQKEDHVWILGFNYNFMDTSYGYVNMDFNDEQLKFIRVDNRKYNISGANSSLCDAEGSLVAWSNGQIIVGKNEEIIEDTINYTWDLPFNCREWEYNNSGDANMANPVGNLSFQNVMILPMNDTLTYVFYNARDQCLGKRYLFSYTAYSTEMDGHSFKNLLFRDSLVMQQDMHHAFTAVRHANGRDWWLVTLTSGTQELITMLVTDQGIGKVNTPISNPFAMDPIAVGQVVVSPLGDKIAWYSGLDWNETGGNWVVGNFDRCSGLITVLEGKVVPQPIGIGGAIAFSDNNQYLYISNGKTLWQYDVKEDDIISTEKTIAIVDTFTFYIPNWGPVGFNFCAMKLGPDGRIYIFPANTQGRFLGVIDFPNESGTDAQVRQHAVFIPVYFGRTVPNMPNYRLGPLDGSPCDTLGIDNHPIAKYRYEADTIDHLRLRFTDLSYFRPETWSWDFGDGSPRVSIRHPYHTYEKNGTYRVCLTVSNENSSNTSCRTITIGTSGSDDIAVTPADITLFPNPVQDYLLVTLGEYIPQHGQMVLYDISGRPVHTQRIYYGQNNVDMTELASGIYVWKVMDGQVEIQSGKVVKM